MRFWRSIPGALLLVLILVSISASGAVAIQVHRVTHPPKQKAPAQDLAAMLVRVVDVRFKASDGVDLAGWLMRGRPELPAIVLCHDLGESKSALTNLAIALQKSGFTLLAFDFRGHGESAGAGSTLGVNEKRDVIGAVDYLASLPGIDARRIGLYGVGMGAHAGVLAAADRPALRVAVFDGLYPDAGYPLVRRTYEGWSFGVKRLDKLPKTAFDLMNRTTIETNRAEDVLPRLVGRDLLLVAPATDTALTSEMQRMYETIQQQRDTEGNLVILPATRVAGLYGAEADRYMARISEFFVRRLARR